jgi:hypothetical protein
MLPFALVFALILLLAANILVYYPQQRSIFIAVGLGVIVLPAVAYIFLPPVIVLFPLLGVSLSLWPRSRAWLFLPYSGALAALVFGMAFWIALRGEQGFARMREQYPYESMEERVPEPRPAYRPAKMPEATAERLQRLETGLRDERNDSRRFMLARLHEEQVHLFVNSPGFGVARIFRPTERHLQNGLREKRLLPQPGPRPSSDDLPNPGLPASKEDDLYDVHERSVVDFVYPLGFGFFKDRRHVAGFQPHEFSEVPQPGRWTVQRVELVGLLMHAQPVTYLSEHLPRMDELREAPTRSLNRFEAAGLEQLRQGEDLHVERTAGGLRMLGAIRSVKQCVGCHGGQRGDLLGAFSYSLRPRQP